MGCEFLSNLFIWFLEDLSIELEIFFVFEDRHFFFEFVGENIEEAVADLGLGDQRNNVIDFELGPGKLIIHLFDNFLQPLGESLTFLQIEDIIFMSIE